MLDVLPHALERILQRAQGVLEGALRVDVRLLGMSDTRQVNEHLRLQVVESIAQGTFIARILDVQRDARLLQQRQPLVDDGQVQVLVLEVTIGGLERQQVVDLEAINNGHLRTALSERQSEVVADESGTTNERDSSIVEGHHVNVTAVKASSSALTT